MQTWLEFSQDDPRLAELGKQLLLQSRAHIGLAFLATLRKDGAPRLHPVSLVFWEGHLYLFIPARSPKCGDLIRDGRYALQAFPPPQNDEGREFYLSGLAMRIQEPATRRAVITGCGIHVQPGEVMFELLADRAMYTRLVRPGTTGERPSHLIWPTRAR
ncbi:MAG: pyridoxamine 5'-phosphate oxidase family protein [Acidobacteriaceae bacterium]